MGWFRSNGGRGALLTVFALAVYHFLSFWHIQLGTLNGGSAAWVAADDAGGISADVPPPSPQNTPNGLGGDFCAICANLSLANTLVLPILAIILTPSLFTEATRWSLAASEPASFDHVLFDARGPPHA